MDVTNLSSSKVRLEAVLDRRIPDQIPWAPLVEDNLIRAIPRYLKLLTPDQQRTLKNTYRYPSVVPVNVDLSFTEPIILKMIEDMGADFIGFTSTVQPISEEVEIETQSQDNNRTIFSFHTPWGQLKEIVEGNSSAETVFKSRFAISSREDYDIMEQIIVHRKFKTCYPEYIAKHEALGDRGLYFIKGADQPLVALFRVRDPVELIYDFQDIPDRIEGLLTQIHENNLKWYRQIAAGPGKVVWTGMAFVTTRIISPRLCKRYVLPYLAEYSRLLHEAGKILICHMCGHIRDLLPILRESKIDGIECMATPPIGDTPLHTYWDIMGEDKILLAGINAVDLLNQTSEEISTRVLEIIEKFKYRHLILRTADEIPFNTPWKNIMAVSNTIQSYDKNF